MNSRACSPVSMHFSDLSNIAQEMIGSANPGIWIQEYQDASGGVQQVRYTAF